MVTSHAFWILLILGAAMCLQIERASAASMRVTIIANPGHFDSIESAATAEGKTDFWDGDLTDDTACTECFAALELKRFLPKCAGISECDIALTPPGKLPDSGYVFVLGSRGSNGLIATLQSDDDPKSPESFHITVISDGARTICVIEGGGRIGTLYGVYAYLGKLGIRFFGLGEQGTVYPSKPAALIQEMDLSEAPAFLTRGFHAWEARGNDEFFLWMARNRMNYWTAAETKIPLLKKLGMQLAIGSHDIQTNFLYPKAEYPYNYLQFKDDPSKPADPYKPSPEYKGDLSGDGKLSYFEAHPEWFGLRGGKRSDKIQGGLGDNFCTSNDDAVAELSRNFVRGLVDGKWRQADVINFWMEDGGKWCECENCKALGTPTDRLLRLVYQVNREVQKARHEGRLKRPVHITTLAYAETVTPPTRPLPADFDYENCSVTFYPIQRCYVHPMDSPRCTEINKHYADSYKGWMQGKDRLYKGSMFIGEYYDVSNFKSMPVLYTHAMSADIPWYFRTGARHFQYMHTPTKLWGTWTLNQYLMARMLWDPKTDVKSLLDGYFSSFYPTTSARTRSFYGHLEDAFANITVQKTYLGLHMDDGGEPMRFQHLRYEPNGAKDNSGPSLVEIMESLRLARKDLDQCLMDSADPVEKARLLEDERRFSYGEAMMSFYYHMVRTLAYDKRGDAILARNEFAHVEEAAEILKRVPREMVETFICPDGGLEATQALNRYKALKTKYGKE